MTLFDFFRKIVSDKELEKTLKDTDEILVQVKQINAESKACFGGEEEWLRTKKECGFGDT